MKGVGDLRFLLGQYSHNETTMWFELLVANLLSQRGDAHIRTLNPYMTQKSIVIAQNLLVGVLMRSNRIAQIQRCVAIVASLKRMLAAPKFSDSLRQSIILKSTKLAAQLTSQRYFVKKTPPAPGKSTGGFQYDPRFLIFEFTYSILLRKAQVHLVWDFMQAASQGQSRCVQMLMGGGKTTVVGPLLALLLGNGKTLVMQVVPRALLEFSRGVMREKFSALIQKPVYTFKFDRFRGVTKDLHRKLLIARRDRAVVCSTPTAVKSFFLKFIEAAHTLDAASAKDGEAKEAEDGDILGFRRIFKEGVFGFFKEKEKG